MALAVWSADKQHGFSAWLAGCDNRSNACNITDLGSPRQREDFLGQKVSAVTQQGKEVDVESPCTPARIVVAPAPPSPASKLMSSMGHGSPLGSTTDTASSYLASTRSNGNHACWHKASCWLGLCNTGARTPPPCDTPRPALMKPRCKEAKIYLDILTSQYPDEDTIASAQVPSNQALHCLCIQTQKQPHRI